MISCMHASQCDPMMSPRLCDARMGAFEGKKERQLRGRRARGFADSSFQSISGPIMDFVRSTALLDVNGTAFEY